jgi:hypothetical protein
MDHIFNSPAIIPTMNVRMENKNSIATEIEAIREVPLS